MTNITSKSLGPVGLGVISLAVKYLTGILPLSRNILKS